MMLSRGHFLSLFLLFLLGYDWLVQSQIEEDVGSTEFILLFAHFDVMDCNDILFRLSFELCKEIGLVFLRRETRPYEERQRAKTQHGAALTV